MKISLPYIHTLVHTLGYKIQNSDKQQSHLGDGLLKWIIVVGKAQEKELMEVLGAQYLVMS